MLVQKFEGFTEAMKFHNGLLKSIFDWLQKGEVRKLAGDNRHDLEQEDSS